MESKCTVCGKAMMGRADRKFCSAACRQKAYRSRESEPVEWTPTDAEFLTDIRQALQMMPAALKSRNLSPGALQIAINDACELVAALTEDRNVTANHNVTAEPFPVDTKPVFYKRQDQFWQMMTSLPDTLGSFSAYDPESDFGRYGYAVRPVVSTYPARAKVSADRDLQSGLSQLQNFLDNYDEMAANLPRLRATAEEILRHHEA